jgi:hypothetical protein
VAYLVYLAVLLSIWEVASVAVGLHVAGDSVDDFLGAVMAFMVVSLAGIVVTLDTAWWMTSTTAQNQSQTPSSEAMGIRQCSVVVGVYLLDGDKRLRVDGAIM